MFNVVIEPYSPIYKQDIAELILNIQNNEFDIPITLDEQPDLTNIPNFYQTGKGNFLVAKVDDEVVGTIALLDIGNDQLALRKMFVDKNYRGKEYGAGKRLLDHAIEWAKEKDVKEIYLGTTEKFVAAQRFYEKNGFVEIEKRSFPVMSVDVKFYRLNLFNI